MRAPLAAGVAIGFGLLVLIGYVIPPSVPGFDLVNDIRSVLVGWAAILAGVAALVGIINLVQTHLGRLTAKKSPDYYSLIVVLGFLGTLVFGVYERVIPTPDPQFQQAVLAVQVPAAFVHDVAHGRDVDLRSAAHVADVPVARSSQVCPPLSVTYTYPPAAEITPDLLSEKEISNKSRVVVI